MSKVTDLATELGQAIEVDEIFIQYKSAKEKYENDKELQDLIGDYNLKKMSVANMMNEKDKDEKRLSCLQDELQAAYDDVVRNRIMAEFLSAQQAMEELVNQVYGIINFYITGEESGNCTGSCSTCSGCH